MTCTEMNETHLAGNKGAKWTGGAKLQLRAEESRKRMLACLRERRGNSSASVGLISGGEITGKVIVHLRLKRHIGPDVEWYSSSHAYVVSGRIARRKEEIVSICAQLPHGCFAVL